MTETKEKEKKSIIKSGKLVIITSGRFAGKKAVVVKSSEEGKNDYKKFGHALVAGIDRYPRKVVRAMGKAKIEKRTKVKPFVKVVNFNHFLVTRYSVDFDLKKVVNEESILPAARKETKMVPPYAKKAIKKLFEEKYRNQPIKSDKKTVGVQYFFNKLRF